jgi:hypothetical protein
MGSISERAQRVRELADLLEFLPGPARAEHADKLDGLGMRVHEELALPQDEIDAIAARLWFVAAPGRRMIAYQLRARGVTVDVDEATLELVREGPAALGAHAPQRVVKKKSMELAPMMMEAFRQANPDLAARIDAAGGVDSLTEEQRHKFGMEAYAAHQAKQSAADEMARHAQPKDFE